MVVELQSVSDKALAYMGKDALKHKVLVIYELGGIGRPGSDALEMVEQGMSEGCIRRQIAESTNKGVRPKLVEVDGPMNVWTTTTRVKTDYELNNRVFELTPDDSRCQTQQILEGVFADDHPAVDLGPVQALFIWLAGQDNRVVLPFGPALP
jgi:type II secretory pathway component PulJ